MAKHQPTQDHGMTGAEWQRAREEQTAVEAIEISVRQTRVVRIRRTEGAYLTLLAECEDHQDGVDFWGRTRFGSEWRVAFDAKGE